MKRLTCEMCGSTDMIKEDGVFVCQSCGCKYSVEEAKKLMIEGTVEVRGAVQVDKNNEIDALLKRVFMFLEEEKWKEADEYCEKVLDIDPENPEAYLGKLMVEAECKNIDIFLQRALGWVESKYYIKMSEYANKYVNKKILNLLQEMAEYNNVVHYSKDNAILEYCGKSLTEVFILEGTKEISSGAFKDCKSLKSVTIPNSVTKIGDKAFEDCINLQSVILPNSVTEIGSRVFFNCRTLENVVLSTGITEIPNSAFFACALKSIIIPDNVTKIGDLAFYDCFYLESVELPIGITKIPVYAFYNSGLKNITIPDSVIKIGNKAFNNCKNLKSITIPDSVQEIGNYIFGSEESNLKTLKTSERIFKLLVEKSILDPCINLESIELDGKFFNAKEVLHTTQNVELEDKKDDYKHEEATLGKTSPKSSSSNGCYVATCVYGSYDCPQVWTLRRYRDETLGATWYGRMFIRTYYAVSPTIVKLFGNTKWFKKMWKSKLDRMVEKLKSNGVEDTPYEDKNW